MNDINVIREISFRFESKDIFFSGSYVGKPKQISHIKCFYSFCWLDLFKVDKDTRKMYIDVLLLSLLFTLNRQVSTGLPDAEVLFFLRSADVRGKLYGRYIYLTIFGKNFK